jgi:hypothetical protein
VRLDTACLSRQFNDVLFNSYRTLLPVSVPYMQSGKKLELALTGLFYRDVAIDRLSLVLDYLSSQYLQELLVDNVHALKGSISVACHGDIGIFSSAAYFIPEVLVDRVDSAVLSLSPYRVHNVLLNALPFHKLKILAWSEFQLTINGHCLVATIERNPRLEELSVDRDAPFPAGFFPALFLCRHTLTYIQIRNKMLTDDNLITIAQNFARLTKIDVCTGRGLNAAAYVTDAGICALAEGCRQLESIRTHRIPLSAASLTALFTCCPHLKNVYCQAALNDDAVLALCGPTRIAAIEEVRAVGR